MSVSHRTPTARSLKARLDAAHAKRAAGDGGFTLIELLVVVVIIGILVAIAIPLYLQYQNGAKNKSAESDLRGAISTVEQYYGDNNKYPTAAVASTGGALTLSTDPSLKSTVGDGNSVQYYVSGTAPTTYKLCSWNSSGKHWFLYDSSVGGSVVDKGEITALPANCAVAG